MNLPLTFYFATKFHFTETFYSWTFAYRTKTLKTHTLPMRKPLFCFNRNKTVALLAFLVFLAPKAILAQCGLSAFPEPAGALNPTAAWQQVDVGSGTYADINVTSGNLYSFRYLGSSVLTYKWDMTISNTSAVIVYNNSTSPLRDPWTGGICPPGGNPPQSSDWYSTFNGTVRVNTKTFDGTCHDYVPGLGSATLQYKVCTPAADPGIGSNSWNVEAFATGDIAIPNTNARWGYYNDANIGFNSQNYWALTSSPNTASGWVGCEMPEDMFTIRARRTGFPCNYYNLTLATADDDVAVYINGNQVYSAACCASGINLGDFVLGSADNIEVRFTALCGGDQVNLVVTPVAYSAVDGGQIGGIANGTNICEGQPVGLLTDVTPGSGGVSGLNNGGSIVYEWESSVDGGVTFVPSGVTTPSWNITGTVPAGGTYVFRRKSTDRCGNSAYSNAIFIIGNPAPNGSLSPVQQTICPGTTATLNLSFAPGTAPFDVVYTDGISNYNITGANTGDNFVVSPTVTANYNFVSITDALGCSRTSNFNGGAQVIVQPPISINNIQVTDVACNGGNTGAITISATGGVPPFQYSIDNGGTYQNSNTFNGLAAGSYDVVIRDNFGCVQAYGVPTVVGQPTALAVTETTTDASCANVFDGSITISATGGSPAYTYSLNGGPTQPGNVFSGLGAATYTVYVVDTHGCLDTNSVVIGNTYVISVDVDSFKDVSCFGAIDGSVTVHVNGGIPPYSYSINGVTFQPSGTFNNLSAGSYIITGRDSKGCTEFAQVVINQPSQVLVQIDSVINVLCNGSSTGAIYTSVSGGTAPYTYSWNTGSTADDYTGIAAGFYNVTVTDSKGCTAVGGANVTEPYALFVNVAGYSNLLCYGDTSGNIDITANGGVPPYSYAWNTGATTEDLSGLLSGTYTATVTDNNGCTASISQTLAEPVVLSSSVVGTNVLCYGTATGSADLTVTGGTQPYVFQWSTFEATEDISGLSGGLYYVVITDNNGCQTRDSVLINEPAPLVLTLNVTNISCFDANDGAIDLTVTGGTGAGTYTYAWSNGANTEDISGLGGATYVVTVTDGNGCTATASAMVVNPAALNSSAIVTDVTCNGASDGRIDLIISGGTPGYTYAWSNGATSEDLSGIVAGSYVFTATDSKGCTISDTVVVIEPQPLSTSGFIKHVTCAGNADACIDITAYGGTLPYSFTWSNGSSTEDVCNLNGGNYFVSVTDAQNCQVASLYVVIEPQPLTTNILSTNLSCNGSANGTVAVVPAGGTTPYEYLWNNFVTDSAQSGLGGGRYVVLVTDSNGCHTYDTAWVVEPAPIAITGVVTDAPCNNTSTGGIDITVTGGTSPYTFSWSNGATSEDLPNLPAGVYTVTVTDNNGCTAAATFEVHQAPGLFTTISTANPLCFGASNGFISVDVVGGSIPYTYTWSTNPPQSGAIATNLSEGIYTMTVVDVNNCSATVSVTLNDPAKLTVTVDASDSKCKNTSTGRIVAHATGGKAPYQYEVNGVVQASDTFYNVAPGTYTVGVTDANGCTGNTVVTIASPSVIEVDLTAPQSVILQGMTTQLVANTVSDKPVINYFWGPIDSLIIYDFSNCADPENCFNPHVNPFYTTTFYVTVMNADSCTASDTVTVVVEVEPKAFIPSAFTPNADGLNDRFEFDILGATDIEVSIWDRWGSRIFYNQHQANGFSGANGWDGTKDGKQLPNDTYVYQMKITYFDGRTKDITGTVTLMR